MGFLDRLLGREERPTRPAAPAPPPQDSEDEQALERYRYLVRTAPPDRIEQAHEEAFAQLTPEQRRLALAELSREVPDEAGGDDPRSLARMATRAEIRRPGTVERAFGRAGGGMGGMGMGMGGMGMGGGNGPTSPASGQETTLATLDVAGSPAASQEPLPPVPAPRDVRGSTVAARRQLTLAISMGMAGMRSTIDGNTFDPNRVDMTARIGTVEEWTVTNTSPMDHPLHLHTWPMQIVEQGGQPVGPPTWQDVVNVPARSTTTIRVSFDAFAGRTVYHCHILDHEDTGMMGVIEAE
jgi:FtsP/CotA-like multicopper oxidase with cupredoxin domain